MSTTIWEIGSLSTTTGLPLSASSVARTTNILELPHSVTWDISLGYVVVAYFYRQDDTYIRDQAQTFSESPALITAPPADAVKVRLTTQRKPTGQVITEEILASIQSSYQLSYGEEPPIEPPVTATSVQSGLWSSADTWGGVIPDENTDVLVSKTHTVTVAENTINAKKVTVQGTLSVNETIDFMIGNTEENKACAFILDVGTVNGLGSLVTLNGSLSSTNTGWSYIRDVTIKGGATTVENGDFYYNLQNCSILTNSTVNFGQSTTRGASLSYDNSINFENCVFKNCTNIYLGTASGAKIKPWKMTKTTFIDVTQIEGSTGTVQSGFGITFDRVVAYHSTDRTNWRMLTADVQHLIKNSYLMNQNLDSFGSRNVSLDTCYVGTDYSGVILSTNQESSITKSILHQPSTTNSNNQSIRLANGSYNFVESWAGGASNIVIHNENAYQSLNWSHNIFIGKGDSFTNVNDTLVTDSFVNNTVYLDNSTIYMTERRYPLDGSSITLKNNLVVDTAENNSAMCRQSNYTGTSGTVNLTVDYNAQFNQSGGLFGAGSATLVNTTEGANNIIADPKFVDSTRTVLSWGSSKSLSDITSIWAYFVSANGYNSTTEAHTDSAHSATEIEEMRAWLFGGYVPQNSALVGSGEGGTYIGAVIPQIEPVIGGYYWCGIGKPAVKINEVVIVK